MKVSADMEFPARQRRALKRAIRLEWITLIFQVTAVFALALTLGGSQAMKASYIEDLLSLIPPIAFLVATRIRQRKPDHEFPYGYHRVVSIAYLTASLALLAVGLLLVWDSFTKLLTFEHPPIGLVQPFGHRVWLGWLMIAALIYAGLPPVLLGRIKIPLAVELYDKVLYADAEMNRANWLTAFAAVLGVLGIGVGLWWADSVAATLIGADIVRDGVRNMKGAVFSLMNRRPLKVGEKDEDDLPERILQEVRALEWVKDARVRVREEGHVLYGEVTVVPRNRSALTEHLEEAAQRIHDLDWRLHEIVIQPVTELDEEAEAQPEPDAGGRSTKPSGS